MSVDRDKILNRIANLRARAEDDASSENEALAAATKAASLMESYNVAEAELALAETEGRIEIEIVHEKADAAKGKQQHRVVSCATTIAELTGTECVHLGYGRRSKSTLEFTGHKPDVEWALYLTNLIKNALDREYDNWRAKVGAGVGRGAKASFQYGMTTRINARLAQLSREIRDDRKRKANVAERSQIERSKSTDLIVVDMAEQKAKETAKAFQTRYPRLRTVQTTRQANNSNAYGAGVSAGNNVGFGKPLGGSGRKQLT